MSRDVEFSTYATPTILGEIKRHFRDRGWAIRVPRRLQEMRLMLNRGTAELNQQLERTTTMLLLVAAVSVIGLGGAGLMLYRQIVHPIGEMQLKMTEIATSQDFSHRVPVARMDYRTY